MAYSNGVITAPVSIYDVQQAIVSSSIDLGTLCLNNNINKWSKYKPIHYAQITPLTYSQFQSKYFGFHDGDNSLLPIYQSINAMYIAVHNGTAAWPYNTPNGYYRLTDFNGYEANCDKWGGFNNKWDIIFGGSIVINRRTYDNMSVYTNDSVNFYIETDDDGQLNYGNLVNISDFFDLEPGASGVKFSTWHAGLYFRNLSTGTGKCLIDTTSLGEGGVNIANTISPYSSVALDIGNTIVIPFAIEPYNNMPTGWTDGNLGNSKKIITFNGANFNIYVSSSGGVVTRDLAIENTLTKSNGQSIVNVSIKNNGSTTFTFNELYLVLASEKSQDDYDYSAWEEGWINKTDEPYSGTTYYNQIINDACYTTASISTRKRYARTHNMGTFTLSPNNTRTWSIIIDSTGDGYGEFSLSNSIFYLTEISYNQITERKLL